MQNTLEILSFLMFMQQEEFAACKIFFQFDFDIELLKAVRAAILNSKVLLAEYNGKQRKIEPLGVIYSEKAYLIAREKEKGNGIYSYNLSGFKFLKITEENFDKNGFDLVKYSNEAFGIYHGEIFETKLLFSPSLQNKVLDFCFHPSQKTDVKEDGSIEVSFMTSGDIEIMRQVFRWGKDCKILAPDFLIEKYKKFLEEILKMY